MGNTAKPHFQVVKASKERATNNMSSTKE